MATVIEFYVPKHFRQKFTRDSSRRGKLIEFCSISEKHATDGEFSAPRFDCIVTQSSDIDEEIGLSPWLPRAYIGFVD